MFGQALKFTVCQVMHAITYDDELVKNFYA